MLTSRTRLTLVAALGAQRLLELRWSARNLARSGSGPRASAQTFPLMVAVNVALFVTCALRRRRPAPPALVEAAAVTGLASAVGLRLWSIHSLGESWNVQAQVSAHTAVVTTGPYRWVRHPNYVAVALEFACLPVALGAYCEALLLSAANAAVLGPRIRAEERLLDHLPGYRDAFVGVPRFLPRPGAAARVRPGSSSREASGGRSPSTRS